MTYLSLGGKIVTSSRSISLDILLVRALRDGTVLLLESNFKIVPYAGIMIAICILVIRNRYTCIFQIGLKNIDSYNKTVSTFLCLIGDIYIGG